MALRLIGIVVAVVSVVPGVVQLRLAAARSRPANLRRISLWAALSLLCLAACGLAAWLRLSSPARPLLLLAALIFIGLWLGTVYAFSKHNTTM